MGMEKGTVSTLSIFIFAPFAAQTEGFLIYRLFLTASQNSVVVAFPP